MTDMANKNLGNGKEIIETLSKKSEAITSDLYLEDILKLIVTATAEVIILSYEMKGI